MGLHLIPLNFPLGCGPGGVCVCSGGGLLLGGSALGGRGVSALLGCLLLGGVCSWGRGGVCSGGGRCLLLRGVCSWGVSALQGVSALGWVVCSGGVSALGSVCSGEVSTPGGIPACTEADSSPLTESQTPVKTLPCPNFGKYSGSWLVSANDRRN